MVLLGMEIFVVISYLGIRLRFWGVYTVLEIFLLVVRVMVLGGVFGLCMLILLSRGWGSDKFISLFFY